MQPCSPGLAEAASSLLEAAHREGEKQGYPDELAEC